MTFNPNSDRPSIPVICVAGAKGGVGKSSVAASLAQRLTAEGHQATIIDLDVQGPSLPTLLNLPPAKAVDGKLLPHRLPGGSGAWSPGQLFAEHRHLTMGDGQLEALLGLIVGSLDLTGDKVLVVDLPPGTSEVQHLVNLMWQPAGTLMVTTGSRVAHADLMRGLDIAVKPIGLVENLTRAVATTASGEAVEVRLYDGASTEAFAADRDLAYLGSLPHAPEAADLAATDELGVVAAAVIDHIERAHEPVGASAAAI